MSYNTAYTTQFEALDGAMYEIRIDVNGYTGKPVGISLDGDQPCVIDWPETDRADPVQGSTCTLRVSNEADRQMTLLMDHFATCHVFRNGAAYWRGHLDQTVYEEPYSFADGYVTELTFSDFGLLNHVRYRSLALGATDVVSVEALVRECLAATRVFGDPADEAWTHALKDASGYPVSLSQVLLHAGRFGDDETLHDVLEQTLRPLCLRVMQMAGKVRLYDLETLRDGTDRPANIAWKGTDAFLRSTEYFHSYDIGFDHASEETIAEADTGLDSLEWTGNEPAVPYSYDTDVIQPGNTGFYVMAPLSAPDNTQARLFKTRRWLSATDDTGYAWRIGNLSIALPGNAVVNSVADAAPLVKTETGIVPLTDPDHRERFVLRANADLLYSVKTNPFEGDDFWNCPMSAYGNNLIERWNEGPRQVCVAAKLELVDLLGNLVMHYRNYADGKLLNPGEGTWEQGAAPGFGAMQLYYFNDGLEKTPLDGWATNRQSIGLKYQQHPSLYRHRPDGEYIPLPPQAGRLRLTVSNCVWCPDEGQQSELTWFRTWVRWHLLRNVRIAIANAETIDGGLDTDPVSQTDWFGDIGHHSETLALGTLDRRIAPTAKGLLMDGKLDAIGTLRRDDRPAGSLALLRLRHAIDQMGRPNIVLAGTAALRPAFGPYADAATPGTFALTALRQDLHQATEELTMARIANEGGFRYDYYWGDGICVKTEAIPYNFAWGKPICAKELKPEWSFAWEKPICVKVEKKTDKDN